MFVRRLIFPLALAPFLLAAQAPSPSPSPSPSPAAVAKKPASNANETLCKKFRAPTGTRLGERKICKTNAEWHTIEQEIFDALDRVQRKPYQ